MFLLLILLLLLLLQKEQEWLVQKFMGKCNYKAPNTQIGTTATKALSSFTGSDAITFGTPVALSAGNFFVSIESPAIGGAGMDTLRFIYCSSCSSTDSLSWLYSTVTPTICWCCVRCRLGIKCCWCLLIT